MTKWVIGPEELGLRVRFGNPVATVMSLITGDVCGIYFVFTSPLARGQGVGAVMTRHALIDSG